MSDEGVAFLVSEEALVVLVEIVVRLFEVSSHPCGHLSRSQLVSCFKSNFSSSHGVLLPQNFLGELVTI